MKGGPVQFGRYLLVDRINVGGMAEVFMAKAFGVEGFERVLAIKRILPNMADDDEFINMFVDEARIAVQLSHANIIQIYELGKFENQYYIAMEYVSGKDLRQILDSYRKRQQTVPIPAAAYIAAKICEGLDYAHRKTDPTGRPLNVIHRDVSPQNILISFEGAVKITDFGIAKAEDRASKTQAGVLKGKFGYMSPEQVRGLEIDHRSDVFAVGILLYEMVTGHRLFVGESDFSTLEKVRNAEVTPPSQLNPAISEPLERLMLKALSRDRDERYAWASDLHDDLQQFLIEDNTIFNAKRIAALLKTEFTDDIERERHRMEEFMQVQRPLDLGGMGDYTFEVHGTMDSRAEKTMIFESLGNGADFNDAATSVGLDDTSEGMTAGEYEVNTPSPRVEVRSTSSKAKRKPDKPKSHVGFLVVGISVLLSVLGILIVALTTPPTQLGTLVITSDPTKIELLLDGQSIGGQTPITRSNVTLGMHTLHAKAKGYEEKIYKFELEGPESAVIDIKLEPIGGKKPAGASNTANTTTANTTVPTANATPSVNTATSATAATNQPSTQPTTSNTTNTTAVLPIGPAIIEVLSVPTGAQVKIGGVVKGITPISFTYSERNQPLAIEVIKDGYDAVTEKIILKDGEQKHTVTVNLSPIKTSVTTPASTETAIVTKANLIVLSKPSGATVFSGPNRQGITPLTIKDLDPARSYMLKVVKEGYQDNELTVAMQGRSEVTVMAELDRDRKPTPVATVSKRPTPTNRDRDKHKDPKDKNKNKDKSKDKTKDKTKDNASAANPCTGTGAKLSVMAKGVADCKVTVGTAMLGVSPFFNKDAPIGKCKISIICPNGKKYNETRTLKAGGREKLIIESDMWK
ncbi:MAG: serine/threonine protein kinase [Deltaproteobacteria bacterium]|nr:serine/threonine protein kinase [Deltaproteobacteria bacterium]